MEGSTRLSRQADSRSSTSQQGTPAPKKYICKFDGCGKSFTRSEHLQRHALNHDAGKNTCQRCRAHFKRPDLLERHMARHRLKDEEAGGEGLGKLETRKRLWRDADGNIVTKKPSIAAASKAASAADDTGAIAGLLSQDGAPISPPTSTRESASFGNEEAQQISDFMDDPWVLGAPEVTPLSGSNHTFQSDYFWSQHNNSIQPLNSSSTDIPYDDIFNPDTAHSFNMPFTTMTNYNWLFNVDLASSQTQYDQSFDPLSMAPKDALQSQFDPSMSNLSDPQPPSTEISTGESPIFSEAISYTSPALLHSPGQYSAHSSMVSQPGLFHGRQQTTPRTGGVSSGSVGSSDHASIGHARAASKTSMGAPIIPASQSNNDMVRTFCSMKRSSTLPVVDEIARAQVLDLITNAHPVTPEGNPITRDHPRLSLSALQNYCDLFFSRFNVSYPLLHQATFDPSHVDTLLLTSVLLLGATYSEKDAHQLAVCIHDVLRAQIFSNASFSAQPELWMLQTILLVECFGKSRAGQKQHDMSHLFHGLLINLIRRSDCQTARPQGLDEGTGDLEQIWHAWIEVEQKKRLAMLCFMWDVQHAVLFCQSLCMSAFELRSTLPCDPCVWEAESAEDWQKMRRKEKTPPLFLSILKSYLTPGGSLPSRSLNALSRVLILHGLMSISWDMKRRDQTSLGLAGNDPVIGNWKTRMARSYDAWKADFDTYFMNMTNAIGDDQRLRQDFGRFSTAHIAIYHAAHVILDAEFLDLQIYAGARHILGRPVARPDYDRSRRIVKRWATEDSTAAARAGWHAAHILRESIMNLDNFDAINLFHYPWCLYLATITCWAFHYASPSTNDPDTLGQSSSQPLAASSPAMSSHSLSHAPQTLNFHRNSASSPTDNLGGDEIVWDAKAEMNALVSGMTSTIPENLGRLVGRYRTSGLTAVMAKHLSTVRWAVVHEGMKVLRGLVPGRLITEYDSLLR